MDNRVASAPAMLVYCESVLFASTSDFTTMNTIDDGAAALLPVPTGQQQAGAGLGGLPLHAQALITGLRPARDALEHGVLLRLLEIGFLPGETVRVLARGAMGAGPIAVRLGQVTFALRQQEASMIQVQLHDGPAAAAQAAAPARSSTALATAKEL